MNWASALALVLAAQVGAPAAPTPTQAPTPQAPPQAPPRPPLPQPPQQKGPATAGKGKGAKAEPFVPRPYVPLKLDPEPPVAPSEVKVIEIVPREANEADLLVLSRPYSSPMVGAVLRGARVAVRGQVETRGAHRCPSRLWYAVEPFGYVCSKDAKPSTQAPTQDSVLKVAEGQVVPFHYVMVGVKTDTFLPMWASLEDLKSGAEPERQLKKGDTIAVREKIEKIEGKRYYLSVDDKVVPVQGTFEMKDFSEWKGVEIEEGAHMPFGWITPTKANVYDAPRGGQKIEQIARRERVDILEEERVGSRRMLRIGEGRWVSADAVNEVRRIARPKGTGTNPQWFDVDLGEQVLVAYDNDKPVYATITSSGREPNHTPRGNYPIWGKVSAITMKSQSYDDIPYYVNKVPWVLFFQAHNAVHGAYWHDRFGLTKSHGCVNVSPQDARHLFEWIKPDLPPGWTGLRFFDLTTAPLAHVHNTSLRPDLVQERNIGPPDREDEATRLEEAVTRREQLLQEGQTQGQAAGGQGAPTPTPGAPAVVPAANAPAAGPARPQAAPVPPPPPPPAPAVRPAPAPGPARPAAPAH